MPLIALLVTVNVLDADDDANYIRNQVAQEIAKGAVTEALEFAESRGFPNLSEKFCVSVNSVEIA